MSEEKIKQTELPLNYLGIDPKDLRKIGPPVQPETQGIRIDSYLGDNFPFKSRTGWKTLLEQGHVYVSGRPVKSSYRLRLNDTVSYYYPDYMEPRVSEDIKIIWEESGVMVTSKPPGLPMHEGGKFRCSTFSKKIATLTDNTYSAVHRLDRETSGAVLCGSTPMIRKALSDQLEKKLIHKTYICLCFNTPSQSEWLVDAPIGDLPGSLVRIRRWINFNGYPSQTRFKLLDTILDNYSMIQAEPLTGRTNQIRIHAAYMGLHLIGDKLYNPDETLFIKHQEGQDVTNIVLHDRVCLHAQKISFIHPVLNKRFEIEVPLYDDLSFLWKKLKKDSIS